MTMVTTVEVPAINGAPTCAITNTLSGDSYVTHPPDHGNVNFSWRGSIDLPCGRAAIAWRSRGKDCVAVVAIKHMR